MGDRSFEEQVRQELEGMRMQPDAQVWENLSAALSKEKRRFGLLWIVVLSGLLAATWFIYDPKTVPVANQKPLQQTEHGASLSNATAARLQNKVHAPDRKAAQAAEEKTAEEMAAAENHHTVAAGNQRSSDHKKESPNSNLATNKTTADKKMDQANAGESSIEKNAIASTEIKEIIQKPVAEKEAMDKKKEVAGERQTASPGEHSDANTKKILPDSATVSAGAVTTKPRRPWIWHVSADLGMAGLSDGLDLTHSLNYASPAYSGGVMYNPGNLNNSSGISYRIPSVKNGMHMALQLHGLRSISKKAGVGLTAGYMQYSTVTGVGQKLSTQSGILSNAVMSSRSDNGYAYLSTDSAPYTNRYHFLLVGVDYYHTLAGNNKFSLRWRAGLGAGILLGSNALYFDEDAGVLYRNNSFLSKTQLQVSTGLDIGLGKQPGIYVGPQVAYSLSKTANNSSGKHLWNASLRVTAVLPNKK